MSGATVHVELRGIHKRYRGVHALRGVDVALAGGEVHGLVGQNGAGKSTLIKVLTGAVVPDGGEVLVDGRPARFHAPADAEAAGIASVYQDTALFPALSVVDNIAVAHQPARWVGPVRVRNRRVARRDVERLLDELGIDLDPLAPAGRLSAAEAKLVAVARAVRVTPRVLVLDEPTAALEPREVERLQALIRRVAGAGTAVLFVSHRLDEVLALSATVTALRDGAVTASVAARQLDLVGLVRVIAGDLATPAEARATAAGATAVEVEGLARGAMGPVDLDVAEGEMVALTGLLGCGASTFARAVAGAERCRGRVTLRGRRLRSGDRAHAAARGVGFLPEDRRREGIIGELSVERNIALADLGRVRRRGCLSRRRMRAQAEELIRLLDIRPSDPAMPAANLSGGNQQKVLLARWLASAATLLLLEEPTHGLDVAAKPEIHAHLRRFAASRGSVVLVSSELAEVLALADRIGVFRDGRLADVLPRGADEQEVTARSVGAAGGEGG